MGQTAEIRVNRLQFEKSPYLLQHAHNPVDWYPWGDEAFEKARREHKPIFLSIGYATCHWCHVMERESFEDMEVASLMNEAFVSIKVDREERPDIDGVFMNVAQMLTGSGGWPLTIIMTPDKKPFFAGSYFPKESRFGRIGMLTLIPHIQKIWITRYRQILNTADQIAAYLRQESHPQKTAQNNLDETILEAAYHELAGRFDKKYGGFGHAPKFPMPHTLLLLLRYWKHNGNQQALEMVERTLNALRLGGIYDHVGFGFHRYATDARWLTPHFEKMLYDQALLAIAYTEAYLATKKEEYARTAHEIFTYVLRDMTAPAGGFYSAEDADSEGVEGKFYLWTTDEILHVLGAEQTEFALRVFQFRPDGNFLDQTTGRRTGNNIIHLQKPLVDLASELGRSAREIQKQIEAIRQKLLAARVLRVHPQKDDKILTDWNGLMIASLAKAAQVFDKPRYTEAAEKAVRFIWQSMRGKKGRLLHRYRDDEAAISANINDYAFLIWGLLELYETTFRVDYLAKAITLNDDLIEHFEDEQNGGFYFTADDGEQLFARQKELHDGAIPSGNSVALLNMLRLGRITANPELENKAVTLMRASAGTIERSPSAYAFFLLSGDFAVGPTYEVVIVGDPDAEDTKNMLRALRSRFLPNKVVLFRQANRKSDKIVHLAPHIEPYRSLDGKATAYICRDNICSLPTTEPVTMFELLDEHERSG